MTELDPKAVQQALELLIAGDVDYDIHKGIKYGESDDHEDEYPDLARKFRDYYEEALEG